MLSWGYHSSDARCQTKLNPLPSTIRGFWELLLDHVLKWTFFVWRWSDSAKEVRSRLTRYDSTNIKRSEKRLFGASGKAWEFFGVEGYDYSRLLNILSKRFIQHSAVQSHFIYSCTYWYLDCAHSTCNYFHQQFVQYSRSTLCPTQALDSLLRSNLC